MGNPHAAPSTALGNTGLVLPRLVFGTATLGNLFQATSADRKREIMQSWFREWSGPVCIDTAGKYGAGMALEVIGRNLAALGIPAHVPLVSNKLGWRRVPLTGPEPTFERGAWFDLEFDAVQDISHEGILRCWEQGERLLDGYPQQLVSVHDPDEYLAAANSVDDRRQRGRDITAAYQALFELKRDGRARAVGVGAKNWRCIRELTDKHELDWVMSAASLTIMSHPRDLVRFLESLQRRNIPVINSAVFHAGFLTGGEYFDYRKISSANPEDRQRLLWREKFHQLCREFAVVPADACIAFALSGPGVSSVALASSDPLRVREHVAAVNAEIPVEFWQAMKTAELIREDYVYVG